MDEIWESGSVVIPARKGVFLPEIFEIAEIILLNSDDFLPKDYGGMLKVASGICSIEVYGYLISRKEIMPCATLGYRLEKMLLE